VILALIPRPETLTPVAVIAPGMLNLTVLLSPGEIPSVACRDCTINSETDTRKNPIIFFIKITFAGDIGG
jgi:hypothetical protein